MFAAVSLVTGLVACFASFFIGQAILSSHHLNVTLGDPNVLRAVIGGALFLTACGMLAFGLGAILRHTAGAITAAIGLLFVLSVLVNFLPQSWQNHVDKWMPVPRRAHRSGRRAGPGAPQLFSAVGRVRGARRPTRPSRSWPGWRCSAAATPDPREPGEPGTCRWAGRYRAHCCAR